MTKHLSCLSALLVIACSDPVTAEMVREGERRCAPAEGLREVHYVDRKNDGSVYVRNQLDETEK